MNIIKRIGIPNQSRLNKIGAPPVVNDLSKERLCPIYSGHIPNWSLQSTGNPAI